ncbi:NAD-dependent epimerase/dehydratase family protein, partial [Shewanella sp. 0m-11]
MIGTALSANAKRAMLLGCGELGKEVAIELQRYGIEVIGVDRYPNAPAMQIAHRSHVINMLDSVALKAVIELEKPDLVIPELEAIATQTLVEMEAKGVNIVPTAKATQLTMDREGIRRLAAETLSIPTSPFFFCDTEQEFTDA